MLTHSALSVRYKEFEHCVQVPEEVHWSQLVSHASQQVSSSHENAFPKHATLPPLWTGVPPLQATLRQVPCALQQVSTLHVPAFPVHFMFWLLFTIPSAMQPEKPSSWLFLAAASRNAPERTSWALYASALVDWQGSAASEGVTGASWLAAGICIARGCIC